MKTPLLCLLLAVVFIVLAVLLRHSHLGTGFAFFIAAIPALAAAAYQSDIRAGKPADAGQYIMLSFMLLPAFGALYGCFISQI